MIAAPVSRHLSVADVERSVAFYRDILGFEARTVPRGDGVQAVAEVVSGPARIQLTTEESALDSTGERRPRGAAILYFEVHDPVALRAAIVARGGRPGEVAKVNWLKLRSFEIHDPDGHVLWFGKSYQEPEGAVDPKRQLQKLLPEFPVADIPAAIEYYQRVLGFRINYSQDNLGVMDRDEVTLLLIPRTAGREGVGSCYAYIRDADALHAELTARGASVQGEPVSHPWGLRDFKVLDLDGNHITFGQTFE